MTTQSKLKHWKNRIARVSSNLTIPVAQKLGLQVRPTGYFPCALEWSRSQHRGDREQYEELAPPIPQRYVVTQALLNSDLSDCFSQIKPGNTTRQFRLVLRHARVYDMRATVVHQSNRIFSELTYEYGTETQESSFWNHVQIPTLEKEIENLGVAHSCSADNYSHWLMEVVPQLLKLKKDLDRGEIDFIYVRCAKEFQREWLQVIGIEENKVIAAEDSRHVLANKMIVYAMPMRNCEFSKEQLDEFKTLIDPAWNAVSGRKIFVGREGGNRSFSLSDGDLKAVVEDCGYEYVLLEQHRVQDKIKYFAEASIIAGPHGGGFGGIVFSKPGTELREIHSPLIPNLCFWRVAASSGIEYDATYAELRKSSREPKGVQKNLQLSQGQLVEFLTKKIDS